MENVAAARRVHRAVDLSAGDDSLMELLVMVDACRRASAARITAVVPYFGYSRQDRRPRATRSAITGKLVANMVSSAGVNRLLTVDLHSDQIQGFRHPGRQRVCLAGVARRSMEQAYRNVIVVSPDVGAWRRARAFAKRLDDVELAIIDKRRPRPNESKVRISSARRGQDLHADRRHGRHRR